MFDRRPTRCFQDIMQTVQHLMQIWISRNGEEWHEMNAIRDGLTSPDDFRKGDPPLPQLYGKSCFQLLARWSHWTASCV